MENIISNLSKYSVLDSFIEINKLGDESFIKKTTKLNSNLKNYTETIFSFVKEYINKISAADIPLPKIIESKFSYGQITFLCEYKGENILEFVKGDQLKNTIDNSTIFDQLLLIIKKAQLAKLNFDPHPKNFVVSNNVVSYVDFTPPWQDNYYKLRISLAEENEKRILNNFFKCMNFDELGFHLAGDLLKIDNKNYKNLKLVYNKLFHNKMISGQFDEFVKRAELIISREQAREEKNIYLL